jgi:hypothetical protein
MVTPGCCSSAPTTSTRADPAGARAQRGVKTRAADELGITYRGLLKKMKRLGMI